MQKPKQPSGKFVLRLPSSMHQRLRHEAAREGKSLNDFCLSCLERGLSGLDSNNFMKFHPVILKMIHLFGKNLVAVVLFGSWARGEATTESDCDILIVLEGCEINRELYRKLDAEKFEITDINRLELQLAALPSDFSAVSGLFAEIATDGIILFERDMKLSRYLAHVRRLIAQGQLIRKFTHGHPYWVHKEGESA